jgi:hypothetical protein
MLEEAKTVVDLLPPEHAGKCVLDAAGSLYRGDVMQLRKDLSQKRLVFHAGCIRGAYPRVSAP